MKMFLMFLSLSLVACVDQPGADEPGAEIEGRNNTDSSALIDRSPTISYSTKADPTTPSLTCYQTWYCTFCGTRRRNVLHEQCDNGSDTIIYVGPCGEPCY